MPNIVIEKLRPNWTLFKPASQFHIDNVYLVDIATAPSKWHDTITSAREDIHKNWPINLFEKHPHQTVHIGKVFGHLGVAVQNISTAKDTIKAQYGQDCVIIFELDEVSVYRACCNDPLLLNEIFEHNNIMITDLMEPSVGRINTLKLMADMQKIKPTPQLPFGWINWIDLFDKFEISPKCIFANTINSSEIKPEAQEFSRYNIHVLPTIPSFWYFTLAWRNNTKLFTDSVFKQNILDNISQSYSAFDEKKIYVLPANKIKPERLKFFAKLDQHDLLDYGDWSLLFKDVDLKSKRFFHCKEELLLLEKYKDQLGKTIESKTADNIDHEIVIHASHATGVGDVYSPFAIKFNWINDYKHYIVLETNVYENNYQLISEKTYKGFGAGLNMVFVSCVNTCKEINNLGFKTPFADMLNYDHIVDTNDRLDKLVRQFKTHMHDDVSAYATVACENLEHFSNTSELMKRFYKPFESILKKNPQLVN